MAGNTQGLRALIKQSTPKAVWTHCMIYRELLATKDLCPELNEVLNVVIKSVNYIKTRPLKSRFFAQICKEMVAQTIHFYFTVIIVGFQEEMLWLVSTICEKS
jgi:hypothetical protein